MRRSKRLMAFLMSVMMVVTLVCNGQLSGGYRVYAEEGWRVIRMLFLRIQGIPVR